MQSHNPWPMMIVTLLTAVVGSILIGLLMGNLMLGLLVGALGVICWQLVELFRLERWLRLRRITPPESSGVWGRIFDSLYHHQRRHRQRRRRLAALLASFRESADAMPDAVVVLREHGEMQWWNSAARELLGLRWPQDEGQRIDNLFRHPDFNGLLDREDSEEALSVPSPRFMDQVLEVRVVPYGAGLRLLIARDVTRLHRLERMRRDFVANISHELRTPLTVIHGLAETMGDGDDAPVPARALELIQQQTERMRRLVEDLLLLAKLETEAGRREHRAVDVPRLVRTLATEAGFSAERAELRLHCEVEPGWALRGDERELRSAFSNLLYNAIKYTPAGGEIHVSAAADDGGARFSVRDTGLGIPAHHIPRLTERFYRVDSARSASTGGTGLGLAIVKHVLNRHEGALEVLSQPGQGSEFICRFPAGRVLKGES